MQPLTPLDGALLIDKPAGPTSHDIVATIRRQFSIRKVGHCGTLDPNATGLLILLLGRATKLSERLMADDKTYEGTFKLGESTSTHDAAGEIIESHPPPDVSLAQLNELAATFVGDHLQTPPMVSAIKQGGIPLYKLARKGIEVERKQRLIHIYQFTVGRYEPPLGDFRVACTKGTYVRTLVHDLGDKLGCGAHLATLRRLVSGRFNLADAHTLPDVMKLSAKELESHLIPFRQLTGGV